MMTIGQVASFAGTSVKTARYYSNIGLVAAKRGDNGYRVYSQQDAAALRFIVRTRAAGFSIPECGRLLALWRNPKRKSADVKRLALSHVKTIDDTMRHLGAMRADLMNIVAACPGDSTVDCPILDMLADANKPARRKKPVTA